MLELLKQDRDRDVKDAALEGDLPPVAVRFDQHFISYKMTHY